MCLGARVTATDAMVIAMRLTECPANSVPNLIGSFGTENENVKTGERNHPIELKAAMRV
jgi:hypothetical protein